MNSLSITSRLSNITIDILFIIEILSVLVVIFFIVTIKMECVKIGYDIYSLSKEIEIKKLQLQDVAEEHDEIIQPERLYRYAKSLDLHFPEHERVYRVE